MREEICLLVQYGVGDVFYKSGYAFFWTRGFPRLLKRQRYVQSRIIFAVISLFLKEREFYSDGAWDII